MDINKWLKSHKLLLVLFYLVFCLIILAADLSCLKLGPARLGIDYADFYATGKMVIDGNVSDIYNMSVHHAALERMFGEIPYLLEWIYPPSFLLPIVPLSYLSFDISLALWLLITLVPAIYAIYLLSGKSKSAVLFTLSYPGIFMNIRWGQNGFLSTALIGFGLYFTESNPMLAGLMFGLLTYKPQMAVIPLIILLFTKKWRTFFWSCIFAFALIIVSGAVFGFNTWINFISTSTYNASMLHTSWSGTNWGIPTLYTTLSCLGVKGILLYTIIGIIALVAVVSCIWVWKQTESLALRGASLVFGIFLSIPYLSLYDFAIFSIPFVLLFSEARKNKSQSLLFKPSVIIGLWFLPLICLLIFLVTKIQLCPIILAIYMVMIVCSVKNKNKISNSKTNSCFWPTSS